MTDNSLESLLETLLPVTDEDWENALKEVVQHLALLGLWRSKFFEYATFYGGTALRIFHGLRRFSEDMEFSLIRPDSSFSLTPYLSMIQSELVSFGFDFSVETKVKHITTATESAFIKGNTIRNLIIIEASPEITGRLHRNKTVRIKPMPFP